MCVQDSVCFTPGQVRRQQGAAAGSFIGSIGQESGAPACSPGLVTSLSFISLSFRFFAQRGPWTWESPQTLPTSLCTCCILQECRSKESLLYFSGAQEACRTVKDGAAGWGDQPLLWAGNLVLIMSPIPGLLLSLCWLKMTPNFMASQSEFGIIWYYFSCFCRFVGLIRVGLFLCSCCQRRLGCYFPQFEDCWKETGRVRLGKESLRGQDGLLFGGLYLQISTWKWWGQLSVSTYTFFIVLFVCNLSAKFE